MGTHTHTRHTYTARPLIYYIFMQLYNMYAQCQTQTPPPPRHSLLSRPHSPKHVTCSTVVSLLRNLAELSIHPEHWMYVRSRVCVCVSTWIWICCMRVPSSETQECTYAYMTLLYAFIPCFFCVCVCLCTPLCVCVEKSTKANKLTATGVCAYFYTYCT